MVELIKSLIGNNNSNNYISEEEEIGVSESNMNISYSIEEPIPDSLKFKTEMKRCSTSSLVLSDMEMDIEVARSIEEINKKLHIREQFF